MYVNWYNALFRAYFLVMTITTSILFYECCFFRQQSNKIYAATCDYQNHLVAIKKVLAEYNYLKELFAQQDNQEDTQEEEKKKNNYELGEDQEYTPDRFPDGVKIFSSDDEADDQASFLVINRELEYLKKLSIAYLVQHNLDKHALVDEWRDYNDYIKDSHVSVKPVTKKKKSGKRVVSGRSVTKKKSKKNGASTEDTSEKIAKDIQLSWPVKRSDLWISAGFGPRKSVSGGYEFHRAIDMAAVRGTPVRAAADGVVTEARYASGYGNTVVITHNRKYRTRYAHLDKICTRVGNNVNRGDLIGRVGATGSVRSRGNDASHLHFELIAFGKKINPFYYLS